MSGCVYVVDDDEVVRESLEALLLAHGHGVVACATAADFLARFDPAAAGCILLDVQMPGMDGLALLETLGLRRQGVPVVMMTAHGDVPMAARAMRAGAADFVEKPFAAEALLAGLADAMARRSRPGPGAETGPAPIDPAVRARFDGLTPREREVLERMVEGLPNKRIASRLAIAAGTVKAHVQAILAKLEACSRTEATVIAEQRGLLGPRLALAA